ncbi:MAG: hypothetical protein ABW167_04355 [Baekduia sp.]
MSTITTRIAAASIATSIAFLTAGAASGHAAQFDGKRLKSGSVSAGKMRKDTLTGIQIRESTLGLVPIASLAKLAEVAKSAQEATHAATADTAKNADHAKSAETAKSSDTATSAKTADDAKKLNGRDQTAFLSNATRTVTADAAAVPGPAGGIGSIVTASCAAEEKAIGGGGGWMIPVSEVPTVADAQVNASVPVVTNGELTGWQVYGRNFAGAGVNRFLRAYVICVPKSA